MFIVWTCGAKSVDHAQLSMGLGCLLLTFRTSSADQLIASLGRGSAGARRPYSWPG